MKKEILAMLKNKKALSRTGHLVFSGLLVVFSLYFVSRYVELPILKLVWYLPAFVAGVIFPDLAEMPGLRKINHRKFIHSRRMLWANLIFIAPISAVMDLYLNTGWYHLTAFSLGWLSHLFGDALTSSLPR
jgi:hypothetical protein